MQSSLQKPKRTAKKLVIKLGVLLFIPVFFLAACGGAESLHIADTPEVSRQKDALLDEFVFKYFEPEVADHKSNIKDCFSRVNIAKLLEGTNVDLALSGAVQIENQPEVENQQEELYGQHGLVIAENVLSTLTKCKNFEKMNLGNYKRFASQITEIDCRKSLYWEKFHATRSSNTSPSVEEANAFGKMILLCTDFDERNLNAYQDLYPWFDWECLEVRGIIRAYNEEISTGFSQSLFVDKNEFPKPERHSSVSQDTIRNFIECIDFSIVRALLSNGDRNFHSVRDFSICLSREVRKESFLTKLETESDQGLIIYPANLSSAITRCFFIASGSTP